MEAAIKLEDIEKKYAKDTEGFWTVVIDREIAGGEGASSKYPVLTLKQVSTGAAWSTIEYHGSSKGAHIDVSVDGAEIVLTKHGKVNLSYVVKAKNQAIEGPKYFWRFQDSSHLYLEKVGQKTMVARIDKGQLHILDKALSAEPWQEVVATGVAVADLSQRRRSGRGAIMGCTALEAGAAALTALTFFF